MKKKLIAVMLFAVSLTPASAITIIWNYDYDTTGFFTEDKRAVLDLVAAQFDDYIIDSPDIFFPEGSGYRQWYVRKPNGSFYEYIKMDLYAGMLEVLVGSYARGGTTQANANPNFAFYNLNEYLSLNTNSAFKPYSGSMSFSTAFDWYTGLSDDVASGQYDFFSVALHELGHILGFTGGTSVKAWDSKITSGLYNNYFNGENAMAIYGGPIPLRTGDDSHLNQNFFDNTEFAMTPYIAAGTRTYFTDLEYAILQDLGYVMIPESETYVLIGLGAFALLTYHRRSKVAA